MIIQKLQNAIKFYFRLGLLMRTYLMPFCTFNHKICELKVTFLYYMNLHPVLNNCFICSANIGGNDILHNAHLIY